MELVHLDESAVALDWNSDSVGAWWWTPLRNTDRYLVPDSAGGLRLLCVFTLIGVSLAPHTDANASYIRDVPSVSMAGLTGRYCIIQLFHTDYVYVHKIFQFLPFF